MVPFSQTIEVVNPQLEGGNVIQDYPVKVAKVPSFARFPSSYYYHLFMQQYTRLSVCQCFTLAHKGCNNMLMRATPLFCSFLSEKGYTYLCDHIYVYTPQFVSVHILLLTVYSHYVGVMHCSILP